MTLFQKSISTLCLITVTLFSAACTPAQENQVLADINTVVSLAGTVLSVAQSFGALNAPSQKADLLAAETYAQEYSAAASAAIAEYNTADAAAVKTGKMLSLFTAIGPIVGLKTPQLNAAVQAMAAACQLLLAQIEAAKPAVLTEHSEAGKASHRIAVAVPFTFTHKLSALQSRADANVALAARLRAVHSLK